MVKKNLPNIILLVLVTGCAGLLIFLYKSFGLGLFLNTLGGCIIVVGVLAFIFFLSIDPGYGWAKNVNFIANYIAISATVVVLLTGVALLFLGRKIHVDAIQNAKDIGRCQELKNKNVADVIGRDWYFLTDRKDNGNLILYLFQKKGEVKNFKVIAIESLKENVRNIREILISSVFYQEPVVVKARGGACAGVFEGDVVTLSSEDAKNKSNTSFDVLVAYGEDGEKAGQERKKFQLDFASENEYCF